MRLSEFILTHREKILAEWVTFARSLHVTDAMDLVTLRDHAAAMLETIALDLNTTQDKLQQSDKSQGKSDAILNSAVADTAAQSHGAARADSGFTVEQMVSEYRALRASVIRLWVEATGELGQTDIEDLMRFNESIDQALAEGISRYARNLNQSKEMFLAMLGHDLRTPLAAIIGSAHVIVNTNDVSEKPFKMASLILSSGKRMNALVGDLLDFTRTRLGGGIPIIRSRMDIAEACRQAVEEVSALHPERVINFEAAGDLQGQWDKARVSQALSNLLSNAVQYGADKTPIKVTIRGEAAEVRLAVHNWGSVIPANELNRIFDPMYRIEGDKLVAPRSNLGLGLYITERIVAAHGGTIDIESSQEKGTTFTIHLPKPKEIEASEE
jgi:signal transduction histidine kinase